MSHISLGTITPSKTSIFNIKATSKTGEPLEFFYKSGKLPQNLSIDPTGEIFGVLGKNIFDLDQGNITLDSGTTTIDRKFKFYVRANIKDNPTTSSHEYSITVKKLTNDEVGYIYAKLQPDKITKKEWTRFIANTKTFPVESLYRMSDKNFRTGDAEVLVLSGVHSPDLSNLQSVLTNNFYNMKLQIGNFKVAKCKNPAGEVIYEIVYAELIDPYSLSPSSIQSKAVGKLYTSSIKKMREALKSALTVTDYEYLPHWMKSTQDNQLVNGYKLVLPIRYVLPGEGNKILFKLINEQTFDVKKLYFQIDRLYITSHVGTTIDATRTITTATGDGSTTTFVLPQTVTQRKHLQVLVDGVGVNTHDNSGNPLYDVDIISDSSRQDSALVDSSALEYSIVKFTSTYGAPLEGSVITFQRKPTTFGLFEYCTFDKPSNSIPSVTADTTQILADTDTVETSYLPTTETIFDAGGTRFHTQPFTLDQKQPEDTQLVFSRENIMDGVNNTSKHRDLVRKAI